jgi:hypothetical protein
VAYVVEIRSSIQPNSAVALAARIKAGHISWAGPLLLVFARSILLIASQALVAVILYALHRDSPWREAGYWWTVYGTLVDIGCLVGLRYFTGREGIRLRDLIGPIHLRFGRDLFLGILYFAIIFPFFLVGGFAAQHLLYGSSPLNPGDYIFQPHAMPLWATVYSLSIWWMIWSPTEEATYQGYALPRFKALTGSTFMAFFIVALLWAAQHSALPFILDGRYLLFRFIGFLPGVLVAMTIYWKTRRLSPLIFAHWPMDIGGALMVSLIANHR